LNNKKKFACFLSRNKLFFEKHQILLVLNSNHPKSKFKAIFDYKCFQKEVWVLNEVFTIFYLTKIDQTPDKE
jgi:hypothetical protein